MAKGNAAITDQILLSKLTKLEHPVTINDLAMRLNWSRGKIDGAINRLLNKEEIAIIKLSSPKGQRRRYVGLPNVFDQEFFKERVIKQKNILVNDPLGILNSFSISAGKTNNVEIQELQETVNNLKKELEKKNYEIKVLKDQNSTKVSHLDPSILETIEKQMDLIDRAAKDQGLSQAELLEKTIPQITDPNFDVLTKIVSIVVNESKKENDSIEKRAALSFLRRARL